MMSGTGVLSYGSVRAVSPPTKIAPHSRRNARNLCRSPAELSAREEPFLVNEPSAPSTRESEIWAGSPSMATR